MKSVKKTTTPTISAMNRFKDGGVVRLPLTTFQPPSLLEVFTYL